MRTLKGAALISVMEASKTTTPRVSAIAAFDDDYTIGAGNRLPWRIPEDSRRFRVLTMVIRSSWAD